MKIRQSLTFVSLATGHFPLLCKWQNTPHVHKWWGEKQKWSLRDIEAKYQTYVKGYKLVEDIQKPISAYVIKFDAFPIGYIQSYSLNDFLPVGVTPTITKLLNTGSIDFYVGENKYIGHGLGTTVVDRFLNVHFWNKYDFCYVNVDKDNVPSIKSFQKLQFHTIFLKNSSSYIHMLKAHDLSLNPNDSYLETLGVNCLGEHEPTVE